MKAVLFGCLVLGLLLVGCTDSEVSTVDASLAPVAPGSEVASPTAEIKTVKVAEVGESLTNGKLKITLNSAEFMETIPNDNEFLAVDAKADKTFAVVDVTVDNVDDEATSVSSVLQFEVTGSDGYKYDMATMATISLDQQIDGKLQPGNKVRGKIAFEVPKDSTGLQLVFDFGLIDKAQAKFNLGNPRPG